MLFCCLLSISSSYSTRYAIYLHVSVSVGRNFWSLFPLLPLYPSVSLFHLPLQSFFIIPLLALCLYPFIFLWLLIPTVNKIFHLNTNKAICMTANQYQKSRDGYCVVCNTAMVLMWICAVWVPERGWSVWRSLYVWGILTKENSTLHMQFYRWSGVQMKNWCWWE